MARRVSNRLDADSYDHWVHTRLGQREINCIENAESVARKRPNNKTVLCLPTSDSYGGLLNLHSSSISEIANSVVSISRHRSAKRRSHKGVI